MKLSDLNSKYQDLCRGKEHPTHMYVGQDIWDQLVSCYGVLAEHFPQFNDARVVLDRNIPRLAAHFWNESNPHHPQFNGYFDFAPSPTVGLEVVSHGD